METVCDIDKCTACMACVDICKRDAIVLKDNLIANNAVIDENKCIGCNACKNVCQVNHPLNLKPSILSKQGWSSDENIRSNSSSGGAAAELARRFIKDGGAVCSCTFDNGKFVFRLADTVEQTEQFVGSKYVKSNPIGAYKLIKQHVLKKQKVLFIGLPCQVAAVKNFTNNSPFLYTVDLICHGTPSLNVLNIFLKQIDIEINEINSISFRSKNSYFISVKMNNTPLNCLHTGINDKYTIAFLNSCIFSSNCYSCNYARPERVSDITIGDSWGSELPNSEKSKGISLILCQTEKGVQLLNKSNMALYEVDINNAIKNNNQLIAPSTEPIHRKELLKAISEGKSFNKLIRRYYPKQCFKQWVKRILLLCCAPALNLIKTPVFKAAKQDKPDP